MPRNSKNDDNERQKLIFATRCLQFDLQSNKRCSILAFIFLADESVVLCDLTDAAERPDEEKHVFRYSP